MEETSNEILLRDLAKANNLADCLHRNESRFHRETVAQGLNVLYRSRAISKAELARRSDVSLVYLHQVFAGRRNPSRDRLMGFCLSMTATLDETQSLLQMGMYAPLSPLNRRDAVLIYGILHQMTLEEVRSALQEAGEASLY